MLEKWYQVKDSKFYGEIRRISVFVFIFVIGYMYGTLNKKIIEDFKFSIGMCFSITENGGFGGFGISEPLPDLEVFSSSISNVPTETFPTLTPTPLSENIKANILCKEVQDLMGDGIKTEVGIIEITPTPDPEGKVLSSNCQFEIKEYTVDFHNEMVHGRMFVEGYEIIKKMVEGKRKIKYYLDEEKNIYLHSLGNRFVLTDDENDSDFTLSVYEEEDGELCYYLSDSHSGMTFLFFFQKGKETAFLEKIINKFF